MSFAIPWHAADPEGDVWEQNRELGHALNRAREDTKTANEATAAAKLAETLAIAGINHVTAAKDATIAELHSKIQRGITRHGDWDTIPERKEAAVCTP